MTTHAAEPGGAAVGTSSGPARSGLVIAALILVAAVANVNLGVANVALPDIGNAFDASQTSLNLVAVGYSLGLASSVLWLGALGDRHGRKLMLLAGTGLSIPFGVLAAVAASVEVLMAARVLAGVAAGMAYPTTLALIAALWAGPVRTRMIALWSAFGGAAAALGPLVSGAVLERFYWGSVFVVTIPVAVVAFVLAAILIPAKVNETTARVDNLGGVLSVLLVAGVVLAINFAPEQGKGTWSLALAGTAVVTGALFVVRQRRAPNPLYELSVAGRRIFWVAAVAGIIVFGSLMGAMFIGQQFLQNVLAYSTLESGLAILPGALAMVVVAPISARLVERNGSRSTLLAGYGFCIAGFVAMLVLWTDHSPYWQVGLAYLLVGAGVGLAGTPASRSLTGAVPVRRAGMASGTADLQRDLGGAVMQSILGALLTAGYAAAFARAIAASPEAAQVSSDVADELTKSYSSAATTAQQYPQYAEAIVAAARESFVTGSNWAYAAGVAASVGGAALVAVAFPRRDEERELLAGYAEIDARGVGDSPA